MHRITAIAFIALAAGCSTDQVTMEHQGSIWSEARGVAIQDGGERIHMGMDWGTTCAFSLNGDFQEDYDFPTETDAIHDARNGEALGTSSVGLHFIGRDVADVTMPSIVDAGLTSTGAIALTNLAGECEAQWIGNDGVTSVALGDCGPAELAVAGDLAVLGTQTGAMVVGADGQVIDLPGHDQVQVDRALDLVYVGATGEHGLTAAGIDGEVVWQTDLPGTLLDIADLGEAGMVVASVESGFGGAIAFLDAATGDLLNSVDVPAGVQLASADGGTTLTVTSDWETHVYRVDRDGSGVKFYTSARSAGLQTQPIGD
ncbi:MAG: hypothetical protein KC912_06245 [Proteobacteria bacterium]|nr:hypothetical protein [Pseudomonadota bacterium]